MKKISLKHLDLQGVEQLSRSQLKNVLGGWTGGTGLGDTSDGGQTNVMCTCDDGRSCGITPGNFPDTCSLINACVVDCCGGSKAC